MPTPKSSEAVLKERLPELGVEPLRTKNSAIHEIDYTQDTENTFLNHNWTTHPRQLYVKQTNQQLDTVDSWDSPPWYLLEPKNFVMLARGDGMSAHMGFFVLPVIMKLRVIFPEERSVDLQRNRKRIRYGYHSNCSRPSR
ncbi:hypothetical protein FE257_006009 [Aspergillus nanangensis]|uniref:Uncharacterized protein n=1 Tax=Aspergillus nanangensis TaxID=2582783 RepID=A0AAD4CR93_ASPNN|nr:hypothetical protein FE257_006009 [Aspergillus nanangensis]